MSFFSKIGDFFKSIKVKVAPVLVEIFGKDGAEALGKAVLTGLNSALGQIVLQTVQAMMTLKVGGADASSDQKKAAAFEQIASTAKSQGIQVLDSTINLMIELAVQRLKNVTPVQ